MKVLLRRNQKAGGLLGGTVMFTLDVRADISKDEERLIDKYRLGKTVLYTKMEQIDPGRGLLGLAGRLAFKMLNISLTVDDLYKGKRIDCKDIVEMIAVQEQIKEAAQTFKNVLQAASTFGGEEVLEL